MAKEKFNINKTTLSKSKYEKVIDNAFTELVPPVEEVVVAPTTDEFFVLYDQLFYDIPKEGDNSHQTLVERSSEYIGETRVSSEIEALVEEINQLREELNTANQTILDLTREETEEILNSASSINTTE